MTISRHFIIQMLALCLIFKTTYACDHNYGYGCNVVCESSFDNLAALNGGVERIWMELPQCHSDGLNLTMNLGATSAIPANWFTAKVKLNYLRLLLDIIILQENIFNAEAFKSLKSLTLNFSILEKLSFRKGLFNGLESLETLQIEDLYGTQIIEMGVLDILSKTLKEFKMKRDSTFSNDAIAIESFTGSKNLPKLENVQVRYPLKELTRKSFSGLINIEVLNLSGCLIQTIGAGAFDVISKTLKSLNLEDNHLSVLPAGLFDLMLPNDNIKIFLQANHWMCDCELQPFKIYLLEYPKNFVGNMPCANIQYRNEYVKYTDFCIISPTTSTSSTYPDYTTATSEKNQLSTSTSSTYPETTVISEKPTTSTSEQIYSTEPTTTSQRYNSLYCPLSNESSRSKAVEIKSPSHRIIITEPQDGNIIVYVDTPKKNSTLIWFPSDDQQTHCLIGDGSSAMKINDLSENSAYIFCMMDAMETTVSPFDCVTYTTRVRSDFRLWLLESSNQLIIGWIVIISLFSILTGFVIGVFTRGDNSYVTMKEKQKFASANKAGARSVLNEALVNTYGTI